MKTLDTFKKEIYSEKVVEGKHGRYDKYFIYLEYQDGAGTTFYHRKARKGYEHLQIEHRPIEQWESVLFDSKEL